MFSTDYNTMWCLLDLDDALIAEMLSLLPPADLARVRRLSKSCRDTHVPEVERMAQRRIETLVKARGWSTLAAGFCHSVCVQRDGKVFSWGASGLLDDEDSDLDVEDFQRTIFWLHHLGQGHQSGPCVAVPAPLAGLGGVSVREVATGREHTLLLGECGGVWSCGTGSPQVGHGVVEGEHGDLISHTTPRRIDSLAQVHAVQVAAGDFHSLVLSATGHVYSFGDGSYGVLGHGDEKDWWRPRRIAALPTRICQVSCGSYHSLAVGEEGELYAWGKRTQGRLGLGKRRLRKPLPARVALPAGVRIRQASGGGSHSLAVTTDGALYSFGFAMEGRLGHGNQKNRWVPTLVEALADTPVRSASAGQFHSVVLTEAGGVLTFGHGGFGQLGHGDDELNLHVPTAVATLAGKEVVEVAAGRSHTVVRLADGEVHACGYNEYGQLGIGEVGAREASPVVVQGF